MDFLRVRALAASVTVPVEMSMMGLMDRIEPSMAWAPPMRPPFLRLSSVSRAPNTLVRELRSFDEGDDVGHAAALLGEFGSGEDLEAQPGGDGDRVEDGEVDVVADGLGGGLGGLHGGREGAGQVDAHDRVAVLGGLAERDLEGAGRRRRGCGEDVELGHLVVEGLGREVDAVDVLVVAEADRERHHGDAVGGDLFGGEVGGAVGDDLDGHG